mmetsp:Transcript_175511/g.557451  ORF Transcript_175511/g.557451 Transcript_175511/m.557451 type:complete len:204 (+) Transcript_175511:143-754(+)
MADLPFVTEMLPRTFPSTPCSVPRLANTRSTQSAPCRWWRQSWMLAMLASSRLDPLARARPSRCWGLREDGSAARRMESCPGSQQSCSGAWSSPRRLRNTLQECRVARHTRCELPLLRSTGRAPSTCWEARCPAPEIPPRLARCAKIETVVCSPRARARKVSARSLNSSKWSLGVQQRVPRRRACTLLQISRVARLVGGAPVA